MIKLNILNMKHFLQVVDECSGSIKKINEDGTRSDIRRNENLQNALLFEFFQNKNFFSIILEIPQPRDYFRIIHSVLYE